MLALLAACQAPTTLRVGAKDFAEQSILAQMLVELLEGQERTSATMVRCGDTYACHRALRQEEIDILVEYTGTGLSFLGLTPRPRATTAPAARAVSDSRARPALQERLPAARAVLERVRARYRKLGLSWLEPLGFDNGYRVLVSPERAMLQGLRTIADMDRLQGIRIACPPEYLRRPLDGLASLSQRYGLRLAAAPLVIVDPGRRFQAVLDGRADAAVGYATDGAIASLGLRALGDPLGFFPPYEAVVVVRSALLRRTPALAQVLGRLEGKIDTRTMRRLNYEVQVEGRRPAAVARRFLLDRKLAPVSRRIGTAPPRLVLAMHRLDSLARPLTRAIRAIRTVFPDRPVHSHPVASPTAALARGEAQMAVLGAERFFLRAGRGSPRRDERIEALAVLATRMVHVIRRRDDPPGASPLAGRVGVSQVGSGGALVAEGLLAHADHAAALHGAVPSLLTRLAGGKLDAALILAVPGDAELARAVARSRLALHPLPRGKDGRWLSPEQAVRQPFLRPARIPAGTYAGQAEPVETLGSQVLLAGPSDRSRQGGGGPAAAMPSGGRALRLEEVQKLAEAAGSREAPDPVLPSAWAIQRAESGKGRQRDGALLDTLLNLAGIAFLVWIGFLVVARPKH